MVDMQPAYESAYTPPRFWRKLTRHAKGAGRQAVEKALWLFYALQAPGTPKWAKRVIYGALGYFVLPLDAIPDLAPLAGYTDDLAVMAAALATVAVYITDDVKRQADARLRQWFGDADPASGAPRE
ncbi:hypothetical protein CAL26_27780 [Bordetella genomosp. 9]|uniref:DUF1232 domain-containing protein n=1 Tax=Bordetella genomosp. 9 TaxID=1416803 RepID=A0A261R8E3_9BORD|nr:DUF1232 domain-containing protein [Bordetella genomosp. 9]OZI21231.1 hypothetical protein CAL26_27780 [Bordetella genomosp. 9]